LDGTWQLCANLAGKDAPPSKLLPLAARLLAAETEFWRCRRQAAGVLHFCGLGYSRPGEDYQPGPDSQRQPGVPDGSLDIKQSFYWFHVPEWADDSGAGSVCMDREGRMYAATRMGVQVFDRNGRSRAILPLPGGEVTGVRFGGANFDTLYATCRNQVYRRKLKVAGAPPWLNLTRIIIGAAAMGRSF
jgi:hypothetical protein